MEKQSEHLSTELKIKMNETKEVEEMVEYKMDLTIENLKQELSSIHAGRVSPAMIESLKVNYYGPPTPVRQVANIATPEAHMLALSRWE